jgi:hypothetical protein
MRTNTHGLGGIVESSLILLSAKFVRAETDFSAVIGDIDCFSCKGFHNLNVVITNLLLCVKIYCMHIGKTLVRTQTISTTSTDTRAVKHAVTHRAKEENEIYRGNRYAIDVQVSNRL